MRPTDNAEASTIGTRSQRAGRVETRPSDGPKGSYEALGARDADIGGDFATSAIIQLDRGTPIMVLGGIHVGCFELFGTERVRTVRDLKGKTVGVRGLDTPPHIFLSTMAAYVGLDPGRDITWVTRPSDESETSAASATR